MENLDLSTTEINFLLSEWVHNKLYRDVCKDRFLEGYTYERIAEMYDMSPRQIKRIVYDCKKKIALHIGDNVFRLAVYLL